VAVAVVDVQVNSQNAVRNLQQVNAASKVAQAGVGSLKNAVAGLAASFTAISAAKFVFAKTAEIESQTRSLQVLTGSVQQAKQIIEELQQLGAVTPFTSTELIDAAKRLQAFGVQAKDVVETTRRLADASGATGAELQGLVTAYGQVQAKGRLQGEELLQFQERGIALQEELRKMYGMTGEEFQKALSKGQISAKAVEVALQRLTSTGGKYANGAIAQSDTLSGKLSTLQDGVDALARRIGQALTPALKAIFNQAIAVVDAINAALAAGRGGGFTRSVGGARQFLNIGATSEAVDRIAKGIGQITSQSNKTGIQQNLQALQQYQRLLQSVGSDDPNANRAVQLQGTILQKINENLAAQKQLQSSAKQGNNLFEVPALGGATGGGAGAGGGRKTQSEKITDIARQELDLRLKLGVAQLQQNKEQEAFYTRQLALLDISQKKIGVNQRESEIFAVMVQYNQTMKQIQEEQANNTLPKMVEKLSEAASGYSKNLDLATELTEQQKQQKELADGIAGTIGGGMASAFDALIQGSQDFGASLRQIASGVLIDIANQLLRIFVINQAINAISGLLGPKTGGFLPNVKFNPVAFSGINLRAMGGSVTAGQPYLVGERGPELFMPSRSGGIAPAGGFGGGANIVVNVDANGTSAGGDSSKAGQLGKVVAAAVQAELVKQRRPGGILA